MNIYYKSIKRSLMLVSIVCIVLSAVFVIQIQMQKEEIQRIEQTQIQWAEEAARATAELEEKNRIRLEEANGMAADAHSFVQEYKRNRQDIESVEAEYTEQKIAYDKKIYLDEILAELDRENETNVLIERYFRIEKEELEEILGEKDISEKLDAEFPDADYWGDLLPVGDRIWVKYDIDHPQNILPIGLVVENSLLEIGYQDARAGMYLFDIQEMYPNTEVENVELEWGRIRYLRYEDNEFLYYYIALSDYGDATILYITPRG